MRSEVTLHVGHTWTRIYMGRLEVNDIGKYADKQYRRDVSTKIPFLTQYNHVTALTTQKNIMKSTVMSQTHHTRTQHRHTIHRIAKNQKQKTHTQQYSTIRMSSYHAIASSIACCRRATDIPTALRTRMPRFDDVFYDCWSPAIWNLLLYIISFWCVPNVKRCSSFNKIRESRKADSFSWC